jgi:glycosyltransferase involved in cell wall biosynthesis
MRVTALLAVHNERRFIGKALEHLIGNGLSVYLIDNESSDETVEIASRFVGRGLIGIETFPRREYFDWNALLARKTELAASLDADWFLHADADELHDAHSGRLVDLISSADAAGFSTVEFQEFTFIPTREAPDHDHPQYHRTMRWYYPFRPFEPHLVRAWKKSASIDLITTGGHDPRIPGSRVYPERLPMRHYLFLSAAHALEKYGTRAYPPAELARGWHGWRARVSRSPGLPSDRQLRTIDSDRPLDPSNPKKKHYLDCFIEGVEWK